MPVESTARKSKSARIFAPTTTKLVVMSALSCGLYPVYWLYRNSQAMKADGRKIYPWARALIYPLFAYSSFRWIGVAAQKNKIEMKHSPALEAFAFVVLTFATLIPDPYGFVSLLNFVPLIAINKVARTINERTETEFEKDDPFCWSDAFVITLGVIFFALELAFSYVMSQLQAAGAQFPTGL